MMYDFVSHTFLSRRRLHLFHDQQLVIWVASLSDYRRPGEVGTKPGDALREALEVFKEVAENPSLEGAGFVVFLNKVDQFREELKKHWIKKYFKSAPSKEKGKGSEEKNFERALQFIRKRFQKRAGKREITRIIATTAVDPENAKTCLASAHKAALFANLQEGNLI